MRVVLDTNVIISALLWSGAPNQILQLAEAGQLTICLNQSILDELIGVLRRRKFQRRLQAVGKSVDEMLSALLPLVQVYAPATAPGAVPEDPDDEMFIACALSAGATFVISGDEHLLALQKYEQIRIVTPTQFLRRFVPQD